MFASEDDGILLHKSKSDILLNLEVRNSKTDNIFVADQTPTPTRLIKNCEEVGLFEDLQHVNPFDETFRRAVEEKVGENVHSDCELLTNAESLHTPQVYQLENVETSNCTPVRPESVTMDVPGVDNILHDDINLNGASEFEKCTKFTTVQLPPTTGIQIIQPQIITLSFPPSTTVAASMKNSKYASSTAIPIQTVKPFILPKLAPINRNSCSHKQPSSASLTPTSQLPIKERLKAILNKNIKSKQTSFSNDSKSSSSTQGRTSNGDTECSKDLSLKIRRSAASCRYRVKKRNEHKELKKRNNELQADNEKLRERILQLEQQLHKYTESGCNLGLMGRQPQIQLPPSTLHLVMNIPSVVLPAQGPPILNNPITYKVEKK